MDWVLDCPLQHEADELDAHAPPHCTDHAFVGIMCMFLPNVGGYASLGEGDSPGEDVSSALLTADH
eukprot:362189-Chlamydomonas_euryale.AAC.5